MLAGPSRLACAVGADDDGESRFHRAMLSQSSSGVRVMGPCGGCLGRKCSRSRILSRGLAGRAPARVQRKIIRLLIAFEHG